jgi:hypothetical protein
MQLVVPTTVSAADRVVCTDPGGPGQNGPGQGGPGQGGPGGSQVRTASLIAGLMQRTQIGIQNDSRLLHNSRVVTCLSTASTCRHSLQ